MSVQFMSGSGSSISTLSFSETPPPFPDRPASAPIDFGFEDIDGAFAVNKALIAPFRPPLSLPQSPRRPRTPRRKKTGLMATLDVPEDEVVKPEDADNRAGTPIKMLSFFTAAKIAKWMAKSYGYRATKKHEYTSQDQILVQNKRKEAFDELTVAVPNLLDPNENAEEASRAASALGGRFLQGPPGTRPSSPMLNFGSVVDAVIVKKNGGNKTVMSGNEEKDAKLVCSWLAVSFGVSDAKYHWAYSREMIRQAKRAAKGLTTIEGVINTKDDVDPVWF